MYLRFSFLYRGFPFPIIGRAVADLPRALVAERHLPRSPGGLGRLKTWICPPPEPPQPPPTRLSGRRPLGARLRAPGRARARRIRPPRFSSAGSPNTKKRSPRRARTRKRCPRAPRAAPPARPSKRGLDLEPRRRRRTTTPNPAAPAPQDQQHLAAPRPRRRRLPQDAISQAVAAPGTSKTPGQPVVADPEGAQGLITTVRFAEERRR